MDGETDMTKLKTLFVILLPHLFVINVVVIVVSEQE